MMLPAAVAIKERDLGEDPVVEINSMGIVLRRGEHEFGDREIAGIEVQRTRLDNWVAIVAPELAAASNSCQLVLPSVGQELRLCQSRRVEGTLEDPEDLF